jgi:hypothetical protein
VLAKVLGGFAIVPFVLHGANLYRISVVTATTRCRYSVCVCALAWAHAGLGTPAVTVACSGVEWHASVRQSTP